MLISVLVEEYIAHRPAGIVLDDAQITRSLRKAVRFYCGYATIMSAPSAQELNVKAAVDAGLPPPLFPVGNVHSPVDASDEATGDQDFDLDPSEYAIIRPLFELYVEHENATSLEASRALGIEVYGRNVTEVAMDIKDREMDMPRQAFMEPIVSI